MLEICQLCGDLIAHFLSTGEDVILHIEDPPPVATGYCAAEQRAEDERDGQGDPNEHTDQSVLPVWCDLCKGNL